MTKKEIVKVLNDYDNLGARYSMLLQDLEVMELYTGVKSAKMDASIVGGSGMTMCERISEKDDIKAEICIIERKIRHINTALSQLSEIEKDILMAMVGKYKKPIKQLEYSEKIPYSKTQMYEIKNRALNKMYEFLNKKEM